MHPCYHHPDAHKAGRSAEEHMRPKVLWDMAAIKNENKKHTTTTKNNKQQQKTQPTSHTTHTKKPLKQNSYWQATMLLWVSAHADHYAEESCGLLISCRQGSYASCRRRKWPLSLHPPDEAGTPLPLKPWAVQCSEMLRCNLFCHTLNTFRLCCLP